MTGRVVVDASGWLEYLADGPNAALFAPALESGEGLLVPSVVVMKVFRRVLDELGEDAALRAAAVLSAGVPVPLDATLALQAARLASAHRLSLTNAAVLAAAQAHGAMLWSQDPEFEGVAGVRYLPRRKLKPVPGGAPPVRT